MLILMRRENEDIVIGDDIVIKVMKIKGKQVHIGIEAPRTINIRRGELLAEESKEEINRERE